MANTMVYEFMNFIKINNLSFSKFNQNPDIFITMCSPLNDDPFPLLARISKVFLKKVMRVQR